MQELDDALAENVKATAEIAARQAPYRTERGAEQDRPDRHGQRGAAAVDDAAQRVAANLVGAEIMRRGRRLAHVAEIGFERLIRRD